MSERAYLTLKLAWALCDKSPEALDAEERRWVDQVARRQQEIELRILATPEAGLVLLPEPAVVQTLAEIRGRYQDEAGFLADLGRHGLTDAVLRQAVERDLRVEAVLEKVAGATAAVTDQDVEIFYLMHRERFRQAGRRTLRHLLVTINEAVPGSSRTAARAKIEAIRDRLLKEPGRFAEQALKHSECPTALNGGLLGELSPGKLYPELDAVAFALEAGGLSAIVESPLGFHILRCDAVRPEGVLALETVRERVREKLAEHRRQQAQKTWIARLFREPAAA